MDDIKSMTSTLQSDLESVESSMDRIRTSYLAKLMKSETTRAITTKYNAEMGRLAEARDALRRMIREEK